MKGSGYKQILFEAQLVTSGSLKGVLSGKAYNRSLFCLKTVCEAVKRLLIEQFAQEKNITMKDPATLLNMTQSCHRENLDEALTDSSTLPHQEVSSLRGEGAPGPSWKDGYLLYVLC